MSKKLNPDDIIRCISALIARNKLWAGKDVQCYFITNKTAGCFTNIKKSHKNIFVKLIETFYEYSQISIDFYEQLIYNKCRK